MVKKILLCWLGKTDLDAASGMESVGLGPVAQAAEADAYQEIVLLNNWNYAPAENYVAWIQRKIPAKIELRQIRLSGPTSFGEIYKAASKTISEIFKKYGPDTKLVFHLSPGTPAMAAVWILLAKTRFPAELIESSFDWMATRAPMAKPFKAKPPCSACVRPGISVAGITSPMGAATGMEFPLIRNCPLKM